MVFVKITTSASTLLHKLLADTYSIIQDTSCTIRGQLAVASEQLIVLIINCPELQQLI